MARISFLTKISMYILVLLLFIVCSIVLVFLWIPTALFSIFTNRLFSHRRERQSAPFHARPQFDDDDEEEGRAGERAPRGADGKIFSAGEGEYVDFEEIKN